jgi:hypothetical protein
VHPVSSEASRGERHLRLSFSWPMICCSSIGGCASAELSGRRLVYVSRYHPPELRLSAEEYVHSRAKNTKSDIIDRCFL